MIGVGKFYSFDNIMESKKKRKLIQKINKDCTKPQQPGRWSAQEERTLVKRAPILGKAPPENKKQPRSGEWQKIRTSEPGDLEILTLLTARPVHCNFHHRSAAPGPRAAPTRPLVKSIWFFVPPTRPSRIIVTVIASSFVPN